MKSFGLLSTDTEADSSRCPWCDYDLQGSPADACPECGGDVSHEGIERRVAHAQRQERAILWGMLLGPILPVALLYWLLSDVRQVPAWVGALLYVIPIGIGLLLGVAIARTGPWTTRSFQRHPFWKWLVFGVLGMTFVQCGTSIGYALVFLVIAIVVGWIRS